MTTTNRAIKSTSITFGLVNVLVKLHKATDSHDISFHQHHEGCGGAVGIKRVCKACEQEVPYANIVKGIELTVEMLSRQWLILTQACPVFCLQYLAYRSFQLGF